MPRITIKQLQEVISGQQASIGEAWRTVKAAEFERDQKTRQLQIARQAIGSLKNALRMAGESIKLTAESVPE